MEAAEYSKDGGLRYTSSTAVILHDAIFCGNRHGELARLDKLRGVLIKLPTKAHAPPVHVSQ